MQRKWLGLFAFVLSVAALSRPAWAQWPRRVFAPYMYIGAGDDFKLTACDDACGQKYFTLAFFIARQEPKKGASGNHDGQDENVYYKELAWDGTTPLEQNRYADQIAAIRKRGGDVIASFGGEAGREIAIVQTDPVALAAQYRAVIDRYKFTWLDFDIEGSNLDENAQASARRNTVLAQLQKKNPGLIVSFTLPVNPDGITDASKALLADAVAKGVKVHSVDLMVMYFGKDFINKGKSEGQLGIDSATRAHEQIAAIDPAIQIGLCPCLGRNGSRAEVFTPADARVLKAFADQTSWVCSLHYWSINDDAGTPSEDHKNPTPAWAFANIFKSFTSAK